MNPTARLPRALRRTLVPILALAAVSCDDPFDLEAFRENYHLVFSTWSVNSSPDEFPTALQLGVSGATLVRPDAFGNFDLVFDVGDDGRLRVIPTRLVVMPLIGVRAVSFIATSATFDQVASAPVNGWETDSTLTLDAGDVFLVRVMPQQCQFQLRQQIYAKFVVDTIVLAERRARLRGKLNPNCGFRSFQDGIPEF